jgi:hypothetical protein
MRRELVVVAILVAVSLAQNLAPVATTPFHPDEARWLYRGRYLQQVLAPAAVPRAGVCPSSISARSTRRTGPDGTIRPHASVGSDGRSYQRQVAGRTKAGKLRADHSRVVRQTYEARRT